MTNISQTALPFMDTALDRYHNHNDTHYSFPYESISYENASSRNTTGRERGIDYAVVIDISILVTCIFGAVGNGMVIWLLGFRIKRNPFSTFILNLAVADFGVLLSATSNFLVGFFHRVMFQVSYFLFLLMYSTSQFLLTAISVDRCVAVFFPLWHRCRRPPHFTTFVCALIWVFSFLLSAISCIVIYLNLNVSRIAESCQFIVNALLCLPVMTVATVALFIKVCLKARQHRRGKLLTIVLLTLLFFLLLAFPLNVVFILFLFGLYPVYFSKVAWLLACLNSTVNPAIYILVGRKGESRQRENMKMILEKVFREEEGCTEETPVGTQS